VLEEEVILGSCEVRDSPQLDYGKSCELSRGAQCKWGRYSRDRSFL